MQYIWQSANWHDFRWQSDLLIEAVGRTRFSQGKLLSEVHALGIHLSQEAQAEILTEETVRTSEIEGLKIDRESVRSSVARRLGLPSVSLRKPDRYTDGLVDVLLDATINYNTPLTAERLKSWQAALFPTGYSGLCRIKTGEWRSGSMQVVSGPIGREKIHFEAPPADRIDPEISKFFSWWETSAGKIEGLLRAGIAHFYFVTIHPFEDGNGRIARAITDMALAQDERLPFRFYTLSAQIMAERDEYYHILERSQKGDGDITAWLSWFIGCLERAIKNSEILIAKVLAMAAFWQRHSQTPVNDRQRKVINRLLEAGSGGFEGGLTTRKYVSIAKVGRATAYREISDLLNKGILRANQGKGRSVSYDLIW
ncbi:MAG: cell filamentation protein Fic [Desulfobacteraceae bacterium IS3]|nr:MAG: cell filamentation protein Fic [Desulfobacteraceae bacterium IS3]